jgi:hypothetical protein
MSYARIYRLAAPAKISSNDASSFTAIAASVSTVGLYLPRSKRPTTFVCTPAWSASTSWLNFLRVRRSLTSSPKPRNIERWRTP